MKQPRKIDKRFLFQVATLGLCTFLPVIMITVNGTSAMRAIMAEDDSSRESAQDSKRNTKRPLRFGVYDPGDTLTGDKTFLFRHLYISWVDFERTKLHNALSKLVSDGFVPLLTVEPWPDQDASESLLTDISSGKYDHAIDAVATTVSNLNGPVYLSWGHEMDQDLTERYPWSGKDPKEYVAAYRYVVDRLRAQTETELRWVWAGVLKEGSLKYWPGDEYADFIGMPIYSFPAWDWKTYGYIRDFLTTFNDKKAIVEKLNKPLMITELGVSGSPDFESFWLHQAFLALDICENLDTIIFFMAKDTEGVWGDNVDTPDWRMDEGAIRALAEWKLKTQADEKTAHSSSK